MKHLLLSFLLLVASVGVKAAPQEGRPPLSKDEVLDLLKTSAPSKVILSAVKDNGIAFKPTPQVLEEFRKAGADRALLEALRVAWHEEIPKPLGDKEILIMLAEDAPSESIVRTVLGRGIDFQPSQEYLEGLRSQGAKDALIDALRTAVPRPFSKDELLQQLRTRVDQDWLAQKIRTRGIDFEPGTADLQAFRNAGARPPLVEAIRTTKRAKPFVAQTPAGPVMTPPLVDGKIATLICEPSDSDVPVFGDPNDLGKIAARLKCGERVTFLGRVAAPAGVDKIRYADGKEGFVANSYLESSIATLGEGITEPVPTYKPDPDYTPQAAHDGIEGTVQFWIVIDAQGDVSDVKEVSKPLGDGLDQNAINTVKKWRFNPATRGGVPLAVRVRVEVSFSLGPKRP